MSRCLLLVGHKIHCEQIDDQSDELVVVRLNMDQDANLQKEIFLQSPPWMSNWTLWNLPLQCRAEWSSNTNTRKDENDEGQLDFPVISSRLLNIFWSFFTSLRFFGRIEREWGRERVGNAH